MADEKLNWIIRIVDKATGPLKGIESEMERVDKAREHLASGKFGSFLSSLKDIATNTDKAGAKSMAAGVGMKGLGAAASVAASAAVAAAAAIATVGAAAAYGGAQFGIYATQQSAWAQSVRMGLDMVSGQAGAGAREFETVAAAAQKMGSSVQGTIAAYQQLRNVGFEAEQALTWTKLTSDLKSLGASEQALGEALNQVAQIASKGTVELEDLKSVAQAGVSLTRMYEGMAKASGKTVDELRALQKAGKLTADIALPGIQQAILATVGQTKAGSAAEQFAGSTLRGGMGRAQASAENWVLGIGDRITPALDRAAAVVSRVLEGLADGGQFADLADSIVSVFERLSQGFADNEGNISRWLTTGVEMLTAGVDKVGALFTWISENSAGLELGFTMLKTALWPVTTTLELIVGALQKFYEILTWFSSEPWLADQKSSPQAVSLGGGQRPTVAVGSDGAAVVTAAAGQSTTNVGGINVTVNATTNANPQQVGKETADAIAKIQARIAAATSGAY